MSFRSKLIISYAAVISVTLLLAVTLFIVVIGQTQEEAYKRATERLRVVTNVVSEEIVATAFPSSGSLTDYQSNLRAYARLLDVRILVVDNGGQVRADTEQKPQATMLNQVIPNYKLVPRDGVAHSANIRLRDDTYFYYARPGLQIRIRTPSQVPTERINLNQATLQTDLWLAVPQATLNAGRDDFLTGIVGAAAIALIGAIALAYVIARSVAKPLIQMTNASVAIAQGDYTQQMPINSNDEIGRLAISFNQMSREVARSQQTMRDFVANVSHELKTPLTSIQGFSQAIMEGVADDPASIDHSATVIFTEAARMRRLVDGLLDLSRIESGQVELHRRDIELTHLLVGVVVKLEPLAAEKNITIKQQLDTSPKLTVKADADRLEQIFTNIVDNALKYSCQDGIVWLEVKSPIVVNDPKKGRILYVDVTVGNTGPLIPSEMLPRIFERFYKLDYARKRKGESTGLGLAITKELVEWHGGTIWVASQPYKAGETLPGEGYSLFTVRLPLAPSQITQPMTLVSK